MTSPTPCAHDDGTAGVSQQWANSGNFGQPSADEFVLLPGAATSLIVTFVSSIQIGVGWDVPITFEWHTLVHAIVDGSGSSTQTMARTGSTAILLLIPAGAVYLHASWLGPQGTTAIDLVDWSTDFFCGPSVFTRLVVGLGASGQQGPQTRSRRSSRSFAQIVGACL